MSPFSIMSVITFLNVKISSVMYQFLQNWEDLKKYADSLQKILSHSHSQIRMEYRKKTREVSKSLYAVISKCFFSNKNDKTVIVNCFTLHRVQF